MHRKYTLPKSARISSKGLINQIYSSADAKLIYPFRVAFIIERVNVESTDEIGVGMNFEPLQALFAVAKKTHKRAVTRNVIRRRIKEAFRLNKFQLTNELRSRGIVIKMVINYIAKDVKEYKSIEDGVQKIFKELGNIAFRIDS